MNTIGVQGAGRPAQSVQISVDSDRCEGHGRCFEACPSVFQPDEEGFARVVAPESLDKVGLDAVVAAAERCPERAIEVTTT